MYKIFVLCFHLSIIPAYCPLFKKIYCLQSLRILPLQQNKGTQFSLKSYRWNLDKAQFTLIFKSFLQYSCYTSLQWTAGLCMHDCHCLILSALQVNTQGIKPEIGDACLLALSIPAIPNDECISNLPWWTVKFNHTSWNIQLNTASRREHADACL